MNVAGSWGLEFHIILEEQRGGKRSRLRTRSLQAGWIDCFIKIKHIPDNLKHVSEIWPTVSCERFLPT